MRARMPLEHSEAYYNLNQMTSDRFPIDKLRVPLQLGYRSPIDCHPKHPYFANLIATNIN